MQTPRFLVPSAIALLLVTVLALGTAMYFQAQRTERRLHDLRQQVLEERRSSPTTTVPDVAAEPTPIGNPLAADVSLAADGTIQAKDFTASLPAGWRAELLETGWVNVFDLLDENVANVRCPVPETGYEAWDFTQTDRAYVRDGVTRYATKWIGAPNEHADGLGWLAVIMGGSPEPGIWGTYGCQIMVHVSAPPTKNELDTINTVFESIR